MNKLAISTALCLSVSFAAAAPASAYQFRNLANTSKCLGVLASNMTNGTPIITYQCDGTPNQNWLFWTPTGTDRIFFKNGANSNKCLTRHRLGAGQNVEIRDCDVNNANQRWTFEGAGGNCVYFKDGEFNIFAMGVAGGNVADGSSVIMWDKLPGHNDQIWCLSTQ